MLIDFFLQEVFSSVALCSWLRVAIMCGSLQGKQLGGVRAAQKTAIRTMKYNSSVLYVLSHGGTEA